MAIEYYRLNARNLTEISSVDAALTTKLFLFRLVFAIFLVKILLLLSDRKINFIIEQNSFYLSKKYFL